MLCQRKVSIRNKEVLSHQKVKVLQLDQFEEATGSVYRALSDVLRMFQIWACKQVCRVAGTNKMQTRYTSNHSKKCPNCGVEAETSGHIAACKESGSRVDLLRKSTDLIDQW